MDRDADPQPYQFHEWWMANRPKWVQLPEEKARWAQRGDESALELFVQELQEAGMVHCVNHGLFLQKSQEAGNVDA